MGSNLVFVASPMLVSLSTVYLLVIKLECSFEQRSLIYLEYSNDDASNTYKHQVDIHLVCSNHKTALMK